MGFRVGARGGEGIALGDIDTLVDMVQQRLANHQPQPSRYCAGICGPATALRAGWPLS